MIGSDAKHCEITEHDLYYLKSVQRQLQEYQERALASAPAPASAQDELVKSLKDLLYKHHRHHIEMGEIGLPDGNGGWIEIDNGSEYGDSGLYELTEAALADYAPPHRVPPRGGLDFNWWAEWVKAARNQKQLVKALTPFAKAADNYADAPGDSENEASRFIDNDATISVADLREARAVLAALSATGGAK